MEGLDLTQLTAALEAMTDEDRAGLQEMVADELAKPFIPNPGPQTDALRSDADILLYGGSAGGGKSALEVGCAALDHHRGLILRREATQLDGLIDFSKDILAGRGDFNKVEKLWDLQGGGQIKFAGMPQADDWRKYAGIARDYMAFDEAGEFLREQVFSLIGWLRTTKEGQRCRVILGSNPPRGGDGEWMIDEFAPWLRPEGDKAAPGELRWAIIVGGETEWVEGPGEYTRRGEIYEAMSRTFIPASLADNPFLASDKGYKARLQSLPEPLRSQLLYGDFSAGREDHEWQAIPSEWIMLAQDRWTSNHPDMPMSAVACDVAQGGQDKTQIQPRYGDWYGGFTGFPGTATPDGPSVAAEIIKVMRDRCRVIVDAGGGYGGDTLTQLSHADIDCVGYQASIKSSSTSRDGMFGFRNFRSQVVWQFREALDPTYGSQIMLPPDPELRADLSAFRYSKETVGGKQVIQIGPKDEMKARLGRSPDKGDTTLMNFASHATGNKKPKASQRRHSAMQTTAILSNQKAKEKWRGQR